MILRHKAIAIVLTMTFILILAQSALPRAMALDSGKAPDVDDEDDILETYRPQVAALEPRAGSGYYNEKTLPTRTVDGETRYFLKITFEDLDEDLMFNFDGGIRLLQTSEVFSTGQNEISMIDTDFIAYILAMEDIQLREKYISRYIFERDVHRHEAHLYVPVKPLRSQTHYAVMVNSGIVLRQTSEGEQLSNDALYWSFSTAPVPLISEVYMGSVPEDYYSDTYILIEGEFFSDHVEVYFDDIRAKRTRIILGPDDENLLQVHLPTGRNRLHPGIYSINVHNDDHHIHEEFGALSVVSSGSQETRGENIFAKRVRLGEVHRDSNTSQDSLILDSKYTRTWHLEIDLDELMGEEVLARHIEFPEEGSLFIPFLETTSKWANIEFQGLMRRGYVSAPAKLTLGRLDPVKAQSLKSKLAHRRLKSEFLQVMGENLRVGDMHIELPYRESDGEDLEVLKYDEMSREWESVPIDFVDRVDKTLEVTASDFGVYVVVGRAPSF